MFEHLLLSAFFCLGIHVILSWPGMIFERLGAFLFSRLPQLITKPLFACLPCMGFWYSGGLWLVLGYKIGPEMLITSAAAIGCNALVALFFRLIEAVENLETFSTSENIENGNPKK